jgi:hypothetical protein
MNVDLFASNPAWHWYFPPAAITMFLVFLIWGIFKRYEKVCEPVAPTVNIFFVTTRVDFSKLEEKMDQKFAWLVNLRKQKKGATAVPAQSSALLEMASTATLSPDASDAHNWLPLTFRRRGNRTQQPNPSPPSP